MATAWAPVTGSSCLMSGTVKPRLWAIARGEQERPSEQAERGVERDDRLGHVGDGSGDDLRPVLLGSRRVEGEDVREAACAGLAGCERRAEVEALAHGRQQRGGAVLVVDDGALGDPCGDRQRRDPHAGAVEREAHLAGGALAVGRDGCRRRDVVVGAAVLVEGHQQGRVEVVGAGRRGGAADRVVDARQQVLAADQRGGRVEVKVVASAPFAAAATCGSVPNGGCMSLWFQPMICGSMNA